MVRQPVRGSLCQRGDQSRTVQLTGWLPTTSLICWTVTGRIWKGRKIASIRKARGRRRGQPLDFGIFTACTVSLRSKCTGKLRMKRYHLGGGKQAQDGQTRSNRRLIGPWLEPPRIAHELRIHRAAAVRGCKVYHWDVVGLLPRYAYRENRASKPLRGVRGADPGEVRGGAECGAHPLGSPDWALIPIRRGSCPLW